MRFDLYRADSARVREILHSVTPLVEPLSLDEAFLDVTAIDRYAWDIAKDVRRRIFETTGLTASAGIAPNKMLAKIASDWRKPNGQFAITPDRVEAFMRDLSLRKLWGVGPKNAERFAAAGLHTCGDLQQFSLADMKLRHGKWGEELYHLCRGEDDRAVQPHRVRKSLSNERTYMENLTSLAACRTAMDELIDELVDELNRKATERDIRKVLVKMKFADFTRITRECLSPVPDREIFLELLGAAWNAGGGKAVRLLGAGVRFGEPPEEVEDPQGWLDL